jgi:hypothetical protein
LHRCSFRQCNRYEPVPARFAHHATIETKLEVFLTPRPAGSSLSSLGYAVQRAGKAYFSRSGAHIKHFNQTSSVAPRRRVYLPRSGD